jgi:hypothetical protein
MTFLNDGQLYGNEHFVYTNTGGALERIFVTALLLTGSAAKAESSILEGIEALPDGVASENAILRATLNAALASQSPVRLEGLEANLTAMHLPVELRRVLLLPETLRRSFVLRTLVGLPLSECSRLLSRDACKVEQDIASAAIELSGGNFLHTKAPPESGLVLNA